jgi:hypothetical protein
MVGALVVGVRVVGALVVGRAVGAFVVPEFVTTRISKQWVNRSFGLNIQTHKALYNPTGRVVGI